MSISQRITWRSLPIETANTFTAVFNDPLGAYGFTQNPANQNQVCLTNVNPDYIYLIDVLSFSCSIPEDVYLSSLNPSIYSGVIEPFFRLKFAKESKTFMYPFPFPGVNYKDNMPFNFWFRTPQNVNDVLIDMYGVIGQPAELVGIEEVTAQISFVIYQENNGDQVVKMLEKTAQNIGMFYRMGD